MAPMAPGIQVKEFPPGYSLWGENGGGVCVCDLIILFINYHRLICNKIPCLQPPAPSYWRSGVSPVLGVGHRGAEQEGKNLVGSYVATALL